MKDIKSIAKIITQQGKALGIEQKDMYMRIGMKQQQYQRVEAGSDIKLLTLLRILEGLELELVITPRKDSHIICLTDVVRSDNTKNDLNDDSDDSDDLGFWFDTKENA